MTRSEAYRASLYWARMAAKYQGLPRARFYNGRKVWYQAQMREAHRRAVQSYYAVRSND